MRRLVAAAAVLALVWAPQMAMAGPAADAIAALEARVSALEARVSALEGGAPSPTAAPSPSAAPSATPSPAPSPTPASTPSSAPTATPAPTFGSRPASGPISLRDCRDVVIENKTFRDLGVNVIAIRLENCTNVTIRNVDLWNVSEGVYALNSSNVMVTDSRYLNITGPYERVGLNRANFVQFDKVTGGLVARNKGRCGDTEDIVSVYRSSGVVVEDNHFEGVLVGSAGCLAWRSPSGSAIALGDSGGTDNIARRNVLVNAGQVGGAFISGGQRSQITDNIVVADVSPRNNIGGYVWDINRTGTCAGHTVARNRIRYPKPDGNYIAGGFWNAGDCGTLAGWSTNTFNDPSLRTADYRVVLD